MSVPEDKIPKRYLSFKKKYPAIGDAYEALGSAVHGEGPLDNRTRALLKVAISGGAMMEGAFHSHIRKATREGITREELEHVALLAMPTIGFPSTMALLSWIEDIYKD